MKCTWKMKGIKQTWLGQSKWVQEEREGGSLRYQVLLTLFALGILGLGAWHVYISGVGAILQQVMEGVQIIRLRRRWRHKLFSLIIISGPLPLCFHVPHLNVKAHILEWIYSCQLPSFLSTLHTYIMCISRLARLLNLNANWWTSVNIEPVIQQPRGNNAKQMVWVASIAVIPRCAALVCRYGVFWELPPVRNKSITRWHCGVVPDRCWICSVRLSFCLQCMQLRHNARWCKCQFPFFYILQCVYSNGH